MPQGLGDTRSKSSEVCAGDKKDSSSECQQNQGRDHWRWFRMKQLPFPTGLWLPNCRQGGADPACWGSLDMNATKASCPRFLRLSLLLATSSSRLSPSSVQTPHACTRAFIISSTSCLGDRDMNHWDLSSHVHTDGHRVSAQSLICLQPSPLHYAYDFSLHFLICHPTKTEIV